jgi:hypothetical protein
VKLVRTAHPPAVAQQQRHHDKSLAQVHGTLDGALVAA